jgi:hypothetical protein
MVLMLLVVIDVFLGVMLVALLLSIKPTSLRITKAFVCPPDTEMEIRAFPASHHQPRVRGIQVLAVGPQGSQDVKNKALVVFWGICCLVTLPLAIYLSTSFLLLFNE